MSASTEYVNESEEGEEMVRRVGGRGRGLVQAVLRIRRERAGRALQNLEQRIPTRPELQEVNPCGQEGRRLGGLQARGRQNQTIDKDPGPVDTTDRQRTSPRTRARTRARPNNSPPTPRLPYSDHSSSMGHFMAPHRCPHCETIPNNMFHLPPYSIDDPDPLPHYEDLFPPVIPHSLTPTPTYSPVSLQYLPLLFPWNHLCMIPFCHSGASRLC